MRAYKAKNQNSIKMNAFFIFRKTWLKQLVIIIDQLYRVPKPLSPNLVQATQNLINHVLSHYSKYYTMKGLAANHDVLSIFSSPWATPCEQSFQWIAGWRPTTLFQLILSESSDVGQSRLTDIMMGNIIMGDLAELASPQWNRASDLQVETVKEEDAISEEMNEWQINSAIKFLGHGEADVNDILKKLSVTVKKADNLRFKTLTSVIEILTPQQAVQFMLAFAELMFGVKEFGMQADHAIYYQFNI